MTLIVITKYIILYKCQTTEIIMLLTLQEFFSSILKLLLSHYYLQLFLQAQLLVFHTEPQMIL